MTGELLDLHVRRPLWTAMQSCEVYCVAGCCGPSAFDLSPALMRHWVKTASAEEIRIAMLQLDRLIDRAKRHQGPFQLKFFGHIGSTNDAVAWLDQVRVCLTEACQPAA